MKKTTLLAGAGALAASIGLSFGQAAFTTPVGYHTETVSPGFNVIGVNLVDAPLVSSSLTAVAGTTLTDANVNFQDALPAGSLYSIEFANGQHSRIANIDGANQITTEQTLTLEADPTANSYIVRKVRTLADYFGEDNSAGFLSGGADTADIIWIPDGPNFLKAFYADEVPLLGVTEGWKLVTTDDEDQSNLALDFTSGLIIERNGDTDLDLTFTGHVKLTPTAVTADAPFTYLSRVYPTGSTLGNIGIDDVVVTGGADTATNIWLTAGAGAFRKGYFADEVPLLGLTEGWKLVDTGDDNAENEPLTSGIIVERNQDAFDMTLTPPSFYADL